MFSLRNDHFIFNIPIRSKNIFFLISFDFFLYVQLATWKDKIAITSRFTTKNLHNIALTMKLEREKERKKERKKESK